MLCFEKFRRSEEFSVHQKPFHNKIFVLAGQGGRGGVRIWPGYHICSASLNSSECTRGTNGNLLASLQFQPGRRGSFSTSTIANVPHVPLIGRPQLSGSQRRAIWGKWGTGVMGRRGTPGHRGAQRVVLPLFLLPLGPTQHSLALY